MKTSRAVFPGWNKKKSNNLYVDTIDIELFTYVFIYEFDIFLLPIVLVNLSLEVRFGDEYNVPLTDISYGGQSHWG